MESQRTIINVTEIQKESLNEKLFRIVAMLVIIFCPLSLLLCFRVVKQYQRALILRFGRVRQNSPAGPGIIWVVPCTDTVVLFDLRTQSFNLRPQEILTKDSVTITVDAVVYYHIENTLNCLLNVEFHRLATELLAVSLLRNILGQFTLTELLTNRDSISLAIRKEIDKGTAEWGIQIERVEIKDVILPFELQKAMAAEAEGTRIAKAKIIEAEGEIKAAENLMEASKIIVENPKTILLRYLQTLNFIATQQTTSIFFPFPIEIPTHHGTIEQFNRGVPQNNRQIILPANLTEEDPEKGTRREFSSEESLQRISPRLMLHADKDTFIEKILVYLSVLFVIMTFPLSLFCIFVVVRQFERAIILRNGKILKKCYVGPGLVCFLPCVDSVKYTDLRTICYDVPPQEALTKDSLSIFVDAVVFYKIFDPICAVVNVANYKVSTHYLAATTLRNALGTRKLSELLLNRPAVSYQVFELMKHLTKEWGVQIVRVEIKDISLPLQLQKAMAAEAESTRLANAKIIVAKAEIESTRNLQKATEMLMDNPFCMQLRYLQSLQMIAGTNTHTIVFPFSIGALKNIIAK